MTLIFYANYRSNYLHYSILELKFEFHNGVHAIVPLGHLLHAKQN